MLEKGKIYPSKPGALLFSTGIHIFHWWPHVQSRNVSSGVLQLMSLQRSGTMAQGCLCSAHFRALHSFGGSGKATSSFSFSDETGLVLVETLGRTSRLARIADKVA